MSEKINSLLSPNLPESASEQLNRVPLQELEGRFYQLEEQMDELWERGNTFYNNADPTIKTVIDTSNDSYRVLLDSSEDQTDIPTFSTYLRTKPDIPTDFVSIIEQQEQYEAQLKAVETELDLQVPEKAKEVVEAILQLEKSLDYNALTNAILADDGYAVAGEVSHLTKMRRVLTTSTEGLTYRELTSVESTMQQYAQSWEMKGYISDTVHETVDTTIPDAEQYKIFDPVLENLRKAGLLQAKYRQSLPDFKHKPIEQKLQLLASFQTKYSENTPSNDLFSYSGGAINQELFNSLSEKIMQEAANLPAVDYELSTESNAYKQLLEDARNIDVIATIQSMEVTGAFEELPFDFSADELKKFLLVTMPPLALAQIKRIEFRSLAKKEAEEDTTLGTHHLDKELGGSVIIISDEKIKEDYDRFKQLFAGEDAGSTAKKLALNRMFVTIAHEAAHALHNVLPVATLANWQQVVEKDPTAVTGYIRKHYDDRSVAKHMEDFADSFAQLVTEPEILKLASPQRFIQLNRLLEEYSPAYQKFTKHNIAEKITFSATMRKAMGVSDEEFIAIHLAHERKTKE